MNYAVVDTGSNTIRMSVYDDGLCELYTEAVFANLAGHIEDNCLTDEGIDVCCEAIIYHRKKAQEYDAEFHVFATAAIRNAKNCGEIAKKVKEKTDIELEILSGSDEGELSFLGAYEDFGVKEGVMADVGGGSSEIIAFKGGKIVSVQSVPIGSLKAYKTFVKGEIPTKEEAGSIKKEIIKHLDKNPDFKGISTDCLCLVGGGIRAANKLCKLVLHSDSLSINGVNTMLEAFCNDKASLFLLEKLVPKRKLTITPGLAIYSAIGGYFGADEIRISDKGIKEGYVKKYLIN